MACRSASGTWTSSRRSGSSPDGGPGHDGRPVTTERTEKGMGLARRWAVLMIAGLVVMVACGEDDGDVAGPPAGGFELTLTIVTPDGDPVAGVDVGSTPAMPEWVFPWGPERASRSRLAIPFQLADPCSVTVAITDVTAAVVCTLIHADLPAGRHTVLWTGRDQDDGRQPPGLYHVEFRARSADGATEVTSRRSVLHAALDTDWWSWGTTDADGLVTVTDRRLVPAFWQPDSLVAVDEGGNELGVFALTTETWLTLSDGETFQWQVVDAVDGPQEVQVVWDPGNAAAPRAVATDRSPARGGDPEVPYQLGLPLPNPFN
ncbi:hypothetical protein GF314_16180 [bacterium]|nr:hypothetical protein [bacterium]